MLEVCKEFRIVLETSTESEEVDLGIKEFNRIVNELIENRSYGIGIYVEKPTIEEKIPEWACNNQSYKYTEICWKCYCPEDQFEIFKHFWILVDGTDEPYSPIGGLNSPWRLYA